MNRSNAFPLSLQGNSVSQSGRLPMRGAIRSVKVDRYQNLQGGEVIPSRVVILTALSEEFLEVEKHVPNLHQKQHPDGTIYECGRFTRGDAVWDVAIVETGQGNSSAADETRRAIDFFKPDVVMFVGVAGGRKETRIGDVVAADKVYNYESGKDEDIFKPRPEAGRSSYRGSSSVLPVVTHRNLVAQSGDVFQQFAHLARCGPVVERSDQFERMQNPFEVALQLRFEVGIQHGVVLKCRWKKWGRASCRPVVQGSRCGGPNRPLPIWTESLSEDRRPDQSAEPPGLAPARWFLPASALAWSDKRLRSCRPGRATASKLPRPRSTWPGTPRPDGRRCTVPPSACAVFP